MAQLTAAQLKDKLAGFEKADTPYKVTTEGNTVTIELDLVDAKWYTLFQKNGLKKTFKIIVTLDDANKRAQVKTQNYSLKWEAGVPHVGAQMGFQSGKQYTFQAGAGAGIREDGSVGKVYSYRLNSVELLRDISGVIKAAEWKETMSGQEKWGIIVAVGILVLLALMFGVAALLGTPFQSN